NDEFDNGSEAYDDMEKFRKRKLKALRNNKKRQQMVQRREIQLKKNDKVRIRAECYGTIPTLGSSQQVGSSQKVGPSQQDGLSQPVKRTKARIINASPVKAKTVKDIIKSKVVVDRIKWTKSRIINSEDPEDTARFFQRIYICREATKQGFMTGMGDLLGLDGAFMKGPFPGQLLTAISLDPNNGIYPMAYGITEAETKES
ncbi:hypothetical protein Tco_1297604, partial [Tanacetum coccineum]